MKKIVFVLSLMLCSIALMAQVTSFKGTMEEAIAKGKAENKQVLLLLTMSGGWGTCDVMDRNVFPTKEAGNYMNDRVVFVINDLSKTNREESRSVFEKYNAHVLPTFILYNGEGVEVSRFSGCVVDVKSFIELIEQELKPKNYTVAREKRYKEDPLYAFEYICYLKEIGNNIRANECLEESFGKINDEERFSEKWVNLYADYAYQDIVNSPIFKYIYENPKKVEAFLGKEKFAIFMKDKANRILLSALFSEDEEVVPPILKTIDANSVMETGFTKFIDSNLDAVLNKDVSTLIAAANKTVKKSGSNTMENIFSYIRSLTFDYQNGSYINKAEVTTLIENMLQYETNIVQKQYYYDVLDEMTKKEK